MRRFVALCFAGALSACAEDEPAPLPAAIDAGTVLDQLDAGPPVGVDAAEPRRLVRISIDPDQSTLTSVNGDRPDLLFRVTAHYSDGSTDLADRPEFSNDPLTVGVVGPQSGLFRANGIIGGATTVRAMLPHGGTILEASATVTVRLEHAIEGPGVPADAAMRFDRIGTNPNRSARLVYPLDGAVMPQNVFPADIQWMRGDEDDLYRIRLSKPNINVTAYVRHEGPGFGNHWLVDPIAWRALAQTDTEAPAQITIDRWDASAREAIRGDVTVSIRFARAAVTGSVYYWDIQVGRIQRIDDGTNEAVSFMPNPPVATDGNRCVGCHTISNSGRWMAGRLGGGENIGAVFDLTADLTVDPPPTTYPLVTTPPTSLRWWFSSWSPDDTRMVVSTNEGSNRKLRIYDPFAGLAMTVTGTLPASATHPAWSPDGSKIAYVANINSWGGAFTAGDIGIIDVIGPDAVGTSTIVHEGISLIGSTPSGQADSYPTWTPDSARIVFAHGDGCRSENSRAALYIMSADGSNLARLNNASGGGAADDSFQPRFSPFDTGDYFWLSFLSRRDYGNEDVGTRGTGVQQIWVSAIKKNTVPGEDPSEVGYWLPGQSTASRNISAYWAPRACRQESEACTVGSECCSGDCRPNAAGDLVCSPPPPDRCREEGQTCSRNADCCTGLECRGNACARPPL